MGDLRPSFAELVERWRAFLAASDRPTELAWAFSEHLARQRRHADTLELAVHVRLDEPAVELADVEAAYRELARAEWPLVVRAVGTAGGRSVCVLACDDWFASSDEHDGYTRQPGDVLFHPGPGQELEEVGDARRWRRLRRRPQALSDLDFVPELRWVRAVRRHGSPLPLRQRLLLALRRLTSRGA